MQKIVPISNRYSRMAKDLRSKEITVCPIKRRSEVRRLGPEAKAACVPDVGSTIGCISDACAANVPSAAN